MKKKVFDGVQLGFFPPAILATILVEENHRLVILTKKINWTEVIARVQKIRTQKLKSPAGKKPHLRQMIGALILKGLKNLTYRETEDLLRYYVPARYLCDLMESDWTPDFTSIQDFAELIGEEGIAVINEYIIEEAVAQKFADPKAIAADTTAQEALIPYPNEVGLMMSFMSTITAARKKVGKFFRGVGKKIKNTFTQAKRLERFYRFFAKTITDKRKTTRKLMTLTGRILRLTQSSVQRMERRVKEYVGSDKRTIDKVCRLTDTMKKLLPQMWHWWNTGKVATGKIVSLHLPEIYSIVRGKAGKAVEFGIKWGITRLRGGYILATKAKSREDLKETKFVIQSVEEHIKRFGKAPKAFAYDRGGHGQKVIKKLKSLGVKQIAIAPRGKAPWQVQGKVKERLFSERSQVEGTIGSIKRSCYGFNRPRAKSAKMMGACGQLAVCGFNLNKLVRDIAIKNEIMISG